MCALDQSPISDRLAGVKEIYNWKLFLSILCLFIPQLDRKSLSLMLFWVFQQQTVHSDPNWEAGAWWEL